MANPNDTIKPYTLDDLRAAIKLYNDYFGMATEAARELKIRREAIVAFETDEAAASLKATKQAAEVKKIARNLE